MAVKKKSKKTSSKSKKTKDTGVVSTVDLSKVKTGGGGGKRLRVPEGDYKVKIVGVKKGLSEQKETPYVQLDMEILEPKKYKGKRFNDRLYMTKAALWRVRSVLEAMGVKIPKSKMKIVWKNYIGKTLAVTMEDDEYTNEDTGKTKISSRVSDYIDVDNLTEEEDDDDEDEEDEDEDEDDDDDEDDDEDEDDDDEEEDLEDFDADDDL
jgi:cobalamin biosynthesis protein CobT